MLCARSQVGATNHSLVVALGAGNAVVTHDNRFNRGVAGKSAMYFSGADGFSRCMDELVDNPTALENLPSMHWFDFRRLLPGLMCWSSMRPC